MSAIFRPQAPLQVESVEKQDVQTQTGTRTLLKIVGTVVDRTGRASKLAFDVWNPEANLKPILEVGNFITFEGRVVSRPAGERYFSDLSAFNSTLLKVDSYVPPAQADSSQPVAAGAGW